MVGTKMEANEVLDALFPLLLKRGQPAYLSSDNVPESQQNHSNIG
jgi:hypothetical protein